MNTQKVTIYVKSLPANVKSGRKDVVRADTAVPWILDHSYRGYFAGVGALSNWNLKYWPDRLINRSLLNVLPEGQRSVLQAMYEAALSQGLEIEVVDVAGRKELPNQPRFEFLKQARFPVLITHSGEKIEGNASKEQIVSFLSRVAKSG